MPPVPEQPATPATTPAELVRALDVTIARWFPEGEAPDVRARLLRLREIAAAALPVT